MSNRHLLKTRFIVYSNTFNYVDKYALIIVYSMPVINDVDIVKIYALYFILWSLLLVDYLGVHIV